MTSNYTLTILKKPEVISVAADFYSSQRVTALSCGSLLLILGATISLCAFLVRAKKLRHLDHRSSGSSSGTASGTTVITNSSNNSSSIGPSTNPGSNHQYWNHNGNGNGNINNGHAHYQTTLTRNGACLSDSGTGKHGSVADFIFSFVPASGTGKLKSDSITFTNGATGGVGGGVDPSSRNGTPVPVLDNNYQCVPNGSPGLAISSGQNGVGAGTIATNGNGEYVYISPHYVNIDGNFGLTPTTGVVSGGAVSNVGTTVGQARPVTPSGHFNEIVRASATPVLPIGTSSTMEHLVTNLKPRPSHLEHSSLALLNHLSPSSQPLPSHLRRPQSVQFRLPTDLKTTHNSSSVGVPNGTATVLFEHTLSGQQQQQQQQQQFVQHQQQQQQHHHQQQSMHHLPGVNHHPKAFQQSFPKHTFQEHQQQQQQLLLNRGKSSEFELYSPSNPAVSSSVALAAVTTASSERSSSTASSLRSGSICVNPMAIMMPSVSKCSTNLTLSGGGGIVVGGGGGGVGNGGGGNGATLSVPVSILPKHNSHSLSNGFEIERQSHQNGRIQSQHHHQQHHLRISPDEGLGDDDTTSQPW